MPEGNAIHRLAKEHRRDFVGRPVAVSSPQGRFGEGAAVLDGLVMTGVEPYGKHLFYQWEGGHVVHVHLGLFGKFRRQRTDGLPAPIGQVRLRMVGEEWAVDLSGPTRCALVTPAEQEAVVARLGPDPLRRDADPERAWKRVSRSPAPIGAVLMDQSVFAGVGNVFRAEVLNELGIHPDRVARTLTREEFDEMWAWLRTSMREAVRAGKIRPKGRSVYKAEACARCGGPIQRWDMRGRFAYACPVCQPA